MGVHDLAIVIPSRLKSTRLPNKPLIKFNGIPMVIHVALNCMQTIDPEFVFVSSPDDQILKLCDNYGIKSHKSSFNAKSGTDRLVEFITKYNFPRIINVQGDELLLTKKCLKNFILKSKSNSNPTIGVAEIIKPSEFESASVVKIAQSNGRMIYASRSNIPSFVYSDQKKKFKQTGLYMFTRESLKLFSDYSLGILEKTEKIEILRLIENRVAVDVVEVKDYQFSIDTKKNVHDAKKLIDNGYQLGST